MKNIIKKMENEGILELVLLCEESFWIVVKEDEGVYAFRELDEYMYEVEHEEELKEVLNYFEVIDLMFEDFDNYYFLSNSEEDEVREEMFDELHEKFELFEGYYIVNKNVFK